MGVRGKGAAFEPLAPLNTGETSGGAALAEKSVVPLDSPRAPRGIMMGQQASRCDEFPWQTRDVYN